MRRLCVLSVILSCIVTAAGVRPAAAGKALTVFAAASLTETLQQVEPLFENAHPGLDVRLNMAASSRCRIQIEQGAPADVFLSANTSNMDPLVDAGLVEKPVVFAHNRVLIIAPKSNPCRIKSPSDLAKPGTKLVTCSPEVPIGKYTRVVIDKMDASGDYGPNFKSRVEANIVSEEPNVKGIVAKVHLGEADAGVCYASDVTPAIRSEITVIDIPDEVNVIADYPIAVVKKSTQKALAREFMAFILSDKGQELLAKNGLIAAKPPAKGE
jgi:molybdate transport system substrate-binding protein